MLSLCSGSQHTYKELLLDALDYYTTSKQHFVVYLLQYIKEVEIVRFVFVTSVELVELMMLC